jgi:hypothetical protein
MTATAMLTSLDWHPAVWLAAFCAPLLIVALALGCMPRRQEAIGEIRIGNPLLRGENHAHSSTLPPMPLVHLCRTLGDASLLPLVAGMRHLSFHEAAPLLRRLLKNTDPEVQLYAQCVLQERQSALQNQFQTLTEKAASRTSPALLASFLQSGLALLQSPLTPASEHIAITARMQEILSPRLEELHHPRALHAAAKFFLQLQQPAMAESMLSRLPAGSPLHTDLVPRIAHVSAIHNPPPAAGLGYHVS